MWRYSVFANVSFRGRERRACIEIHEVGPGGGSLRVVARTPMVCGDDARADERLAQMRIDAKAMCAGLLAAVEDAA